MSDEQRREDEEGKADVEGHRWRVGVDEEPAEEPDDEVEAHVHKVSNVRMDSPSTD